MGEQLAGQSTVPLLEQLRTISPDTKVAVFADEVITDEELEVLARLRVSRYLLWRDLSAARLEAVLVVILETDLWITSSAVAKAFLRIHDRLRRQGTVPQLSKRQRDVLTLLSEGLSHKAIAARLKIQPSTVSTHISRSKESLGAKTREELIAYAREGGIVSPQDSAQRP
jgi:DNA-binding NarL/FixJ family response regulator